MAANKHLWRGEEMPAHLDNIKDWQLNCGDYIENELMEAVKTIYMLTYGFIPSEVNEDDLWPIVKDVMPAFVERMRADNIPVWNPEADSYEF